MLREEDYAAPRRCFLNVSTGKSILIDLPELHGHGVFGPTAEGLLLLLDKVTSVVRLLNPLTRHLPEFPPLIPLRPLAATAADLTAGHPQVSCTSKRDEETRSPTGAIAGLVT
ncbi:hypothetical protein E2562_008895 [Oryza meyeriana var. granulata]|uniref:Uncharacterized protein n=1 Tax=Oryza meyeriana var. granulata TaxID=110450 RepID=A0A6G1D0G9_9ORYZ|nr:hypothetical protein E2562_008895 [Oryza meyeriana var. granulata]